MSDAAFELRLERAARFIADEAVRPVDAVAIAEAAIRAAERADEIAPRALAPRRPWLVLAAAALATVIAVGASLILQRSQHEPLASPSPLVVPSTSPSPNPSATPPPLGVPAGPTSSGTWLADIPTDLVFGGGPSATHMALNVSSGLRSSIDLEGADLGLFSSSFITENVGEVRFTADTSGGARAAESLTLDGAPLAPCIDGDEGRYQSASSAGGLRLTFTLISDPCRSRAAVLARTWTRSISVPNGGGTGVVDAFDPVFTVELPVGSYIVDRGRDSQTIHQDFPELQFISWKDPQGFLDPCDRSKGRYAIEPGADAFVTYVRQLAGFTVDSTKEVKVDGYRAVRLVVHADADATCPDGVLWEWQPKRETSDLAWFLRPGITDSLFIVDHPKGTLMFEVLPAPNSLEDQVIGSIHFLDTLPTTP